MSERFFRTFKIRETDLDAHNHVNNVAYLRWIQDVAVDHWQSAASKHLQADYTWYVIRHEIDYRGQAFGGEEVVAETWVGKATRVRCERFTRILRGNDLLAEAKSTWCLLDLKSLKPTRLTDELRSLFNMT